MGLLPWPVWVNYSVLQRQDLPNTKCPWITCFYMLSVEGALWPSVSATSSFPASGSFLTHVPWSVLSCILEGGLCRPVGFSPCRAALFCLVACAVNSGLPWSPCAVSQGRPLCSATLHSLCTPAQGLPQVKHRAPHLFSKAQDHCLLFFEVLLLKIVCFPLRLFQLGS